MTKIFEINQNFTFSYVKKKENNWNLQLNDGSGKNLEIYPGFVAVVGYSGSGKSTFLSILGGFESLNNTQANQITYFTKEGEAHPYTKGIPQEDFGFIFQRAYESKPLSAADNVALPLYITQNYSQNQLTDYTKDLMTTLGLGSYGEAQANELSGGQLSRVGILRGLAKQPRVLFADEPAGSLDPYNAEKVVSILSNWQKTTGSSIIMVTHHHEHAFKYADQVIMSQVVLNKKQRPPEGWSKNEQEEMTEKAETTAKQANSQGLESTESSFEQLPNLPEPSSGRLSNLRFISRVAWQNIVSKADNSMTISIITLLAFAFLFSLAITSNQMIDWFEMVNEHRNESNYLRTFNIESDKDPYLSTGVRDIISETTVSEIDDWYREHVRHLLESLGKPVEEETVPNEEDLSFDDFVIEAQTEEKQELCTDHNRQNEVIDQLCSKLDYAQISWGDLKTILLDSRQKVQAQILSSEKTASTLALRRLNKNLEHLINIVEKGESLTLVEPLTKAAEVYPTYQSAWRFFDASGEEADLTEIHWLDYRDPLFRTKQLIPLSGTEPRFNSNEQEGVIVTKELLHDELGYSLSAENIFVRLPGGERVCVPVVSVVDTMPGFDYKAITTPHFGLRMSSNAYHCPENRRYFQVEISSNNHQLIEAAVEQNRDQYGNYLFSIIKESDVRLYTEKEDAAMTEKAWMSWLNKQGLTDYKLLIKDEWEYNENPRMDAPYRSGHIFAAATEIVPAEMWE